MVEIVRATEENERDFVNLYKIAYRGLELYSYTDEGDIAFYFHWLYGRDKDGLFIAKYENIPVGFLACDSNWFSKFENSFVCEIHEIFVHPEFRKRKIGSLLIQVAEKYAIEKSRDIIGLWVGVGNEGAKIFYKKHSFFEVAVRGMWVRMIKKLSLQNYNRP